MQKKIEIILTPKENGGHDMEFILNKNLDTTQFVAFLEAEKDMCEKRKGMALLNELLNIFEKEKTNE